MIEACGSDREIRKRAGADGSRDRIMRLQVEKLNFSYGTNRILKDLSFQIKDGEFVSILGPSGCGKSTLLNVLAGILKPDGGKLLIDGRAVQEPCGTFAYMPQEDLLFPWRTILDNVCLYGEIHHCKEAMRTEALQKLEQFGLAGCEDKYPDELSGGMRQRAAFLRTTLCEAGIYLLDAEALQKLEQFGLAGCEDKYPDELSGGMRQRAAFLRTTLCEAGIYLLDEPFGALDVITRGDMQDWLQSLCSDLKKTILLVTHDTDEAIYLSDRILILGEPGEGIRKEIQIQEKDRTREWLYAQGELRAEIHRIIKEKETR